MREYRGEIRYLEPNERRCIRRLYEQCFSDSQAFMDYYFENYIKGNSRCLAAFEESTGEECFFADADALSARIISMISVHEKYWRVRQDCTLLADVSHMISQPVHGGDNGGGDCGYVEYRAWYLYGIATREGDRGQGHMRRLMERLLLDAREEQIPYVYLIPVKPAVYEGCGFRLIEKTCRENVGLPEQADIENVGLSEQDAWKIVKLSEETEQKATLFPVLEQMYNSFYEAQKVDAYLKKDSAYFREQLQMALCEQGDIYLLYCKGVLQAFATAVIEDLLTAGDKYRKLTIIEIIGLNNVKNIAIATKLKRYLGAHEVFYRELPVMLYRGMKNILLGQMDEV